MLNVLQDNNQQTGLFYILNSEDKKIAEMTYIWNSPTHVTVDHTLVDPELRGQGAAKLLFNAMIDYARQHNLRVSPVCSYAIAQFARDPLLKDLIYHAE